MLFLTIFKVKVIVELKNENNYFIAIWDTDLTAHTSWQAHKCIMLWGTVTKVISAVLLAGCLSKQYFMNRVLLRRKSRIVESRTAFELQLAAWDRGTLFCLSPVLLYALPMTYILWPTSYDLHLLLCAATPSLSALAKCWDSNVLQGEGTPFWLVLLSSWGLKQCVTHYRICPNFCCEKTQW